MTRPHPSLACIAAALFALLGLTGCSPAPQPTPSPTPTPLFASEDEAFAAAETTYREYNDALNQVDPADPKTFEKVYEKTTGDFEDVDRKNLSVMHAEEVVITGTNVVIGFRPLDTTPTFDEIHARVCIDVSSVQILDKNGASLVDPGRTPVYVAEITFVRERDALAITHATRSAAPSCD
ncbi:hypothetical protein [Microbacterium sp. p3-SID336]|uniref:hypothetical protein n=1 Tax=Microbacterium sp. p3-SID336 TaxID=2916212 RepID=UPI0021A7813B|nr:hypothetical protein [Microbacterium sp. p3-SID336]MCT1476913.1 hypothetical protein [Microbacterium sp. p3-SID336]